MLATARSIPLSLDAFLEWEEEQSARYELAGGVVRMMAGDKEDHDRIAGNIFAHLRPLLRGTPCSAHLSNLKVVSRPADASMYPDVFVRCGPREGGRTSVEDAVLVFEVLSPSTARFDLIRKRQAYEAMPSLRRIVYVDMEEARVDSRVKGEDGFWRDETVEGLDAALILPEIELSVPMAEIYAETEVAAAAG